MAVPPIARPHGPDSIRAGSLIVPLAAVLVLVAGATGLLPPATALAAGVGGAALWAAAVLVRAALAIHHAEGTFVACKGAGFVGMGALAVGLTAVLPLIDLPGAGIAGTVGVGVAGLLYVLGTMLLPGASTSMAVRLRRAFDVLGLGVSLGFAAWLITPM